MAPVPAQPARRVAPEGLATEGGLAIGEPVGSVHKRGAKAASNSTARGIRRRGSRAAASLVRDAVSLIFGTESATLLCRMIHG